MIQVARLSPDPTLISFPKPGGKGNTRWGPPPAALLVGRCGLPKGYTDGTVSRKWSCTAWASVEGFFMFPSRATRSEGCTGYLK